MAKHRVLFVTHRGERHQQAAIEAAPPGLEIVMLRSPSKEEILEHVGAAEFLVSERTGTIDADIIRAGRSLKLIQRLGTQTWDIDLEAARRAGIPVCCMPVRTCILVAEHMLMLMLVLARRLRELASITDEAGDWGMPPRRCNENYFAFNWSGRTRVDSLLEATVGIVGFGEIATELARRLRPFN